FMQKHEATKYVSSNPGTVVEFHYDSRAYYIENKVGDGQEIWVNKRAYAYLPAGYDESKEYNVVYFLHGSGHDEGYLFARGNYVSTDTSYTGGYATEAVLDYLMDKGLAEKTIVICPHFTQATANSLKTQILTTAKATISLPTYILTEQS
ncbi:MAG: hypothetical protein IKL61_04245, partial [Clostridia bacterium]|nr:hypothetical protein [Clostridia bacterium]